MRRDVVVPIAQTERKGAAFRVREGRVEVQGLERVPDEPAEELYVRKGDVLKHISGQERITSTETEVDPVLRQWSQVWRPGWPNYLA